MHKRQLDYIPHNHLTSCFPANYNLNNDEADSKHQKWLLANKREKPSGLLLVEANSHRRHFDCCNQVVIFFTRLVLKLLSLIINIKLVTGVLSNLYNDAVLCASTSKASKFSPIFVSDQDKAAANCQIIQSTGKVVKIFLMCILVVLWTIVK